MSFENWCKHYNGLHGKVCRAGVSYESVKDPAGKKLHLPCFKDQGCAERCDKVSFRTPEEIAVEEEKSSETLKRYLDNLENDTCPHCGKKIEEKKQVGRCVYSLPCYHRLHQGTLPKQEVEPDTEKESFW